jgi:hypothetical protein
MKRDMDLIRDIMLEIEDGRKVFEIRSDAMSEALGVPNEGSLSREEAERWSHHLGLISGNEFVIFRRAAGGFWVVESISWKGHDFIDAVRDPEIWSQTKSGIEKVGGFTLDLIVAMAKGLLKKKIEQHTGVEIDI